MLQVRKLNFLPIYYRDRYRVFQCEKMNEKMDDCQDPPQDVRHRIHRYNKEARGSIHQCHGAPTSVLVNFAACYRLVQLILKIDFTLAKMVRQVEVVIHDMPCTWWLSLVAVERPWSAITGPFLFFQYEWVQNPLSLHFWHFRQVSVGKSVC